MDYMKLDAGDQGMTLRQLPSNMSCFTELAGNIQTLESAVLLRRSSFAIKCNTKLAVHN